MKRKPVQIDRDKLRTAVRKLGNECVFYMLDDAIELLPPTKLEKIAKKYLDVKPLRPDSEQATTRSLLKVVQRFQKASLAGEYYESFNVNSKDFIEESPGTARDGYPEYRTRAVRFPKRMGHHCRICGRSRPNEKFSGRGHRIHVCKECQRMPREKRDCLERLDELHGFLQQSMISRKNVARLKTLARHEDHEVAELAALILEIARVLPGKRNRWLKLARQHSPLFHRAVDHWGVEALGLGCYERAIKLRESFEKITKLLACGCHVASHADLALPDFSRRHFMHLPLLVFSR